MDLGDSILNSPLVEQDPMRIECASVKARSMLWIAFPLRAIGHATFPYKPGQEITLSYYASFEKLNEPLVVILPGTGAAYLYVPFEPKELVPLSGRFVDKELVRQVTGKSLNFFASYVAVAYNIRVHSLVCKKAAGREYRTIKRIATVVSPKTPILFSI